MNRLTIPDFFAAAASRRPGHPFLVFGDGEISYAGAGECVRRLTAGLSRLGVKQSDRVACYLGNCPEFLWTWFAVNTLGATLVPINTAFRVEEARYIVEHSGASLLVTGFEGYEVASEIRRRIKSLRELVVVGGDVRLPDTRFEELCDEDPDRLVPQVAGDSLATIIYTSGTTGRPKGVMQPQRNYVLTGEGFRTWLDLGPHDRLMTPLPLFHINAQAYSTMGAIAAEATLVLLERFSVSRFWQQARHYGATQANLIGSMLTVLAKAPPVGEDGAHSLRIIYAAPIPREMYADFEPRFHVTLVEGYGLSECTFGTIQPLNATRKPGSIGLPRSLPARGITNEIRILAADGRECGPGEMGEIVIRNPVMMVGYFADPALTAEALQDGWLRTGDVGYKDSEDYLFFVDRRNDIVRRRGENVAPREVEETLNAHPDVLESAVVGVPSPLTEEDIIAVVVPRRGAPLSEAELVNWCAMRLARFKVPTRVILAETLPKTSTARVQKNLLRDQLMRALGMRPE